MNTVIGVQIIFGSEGQKYFINKLENEENEYIYNTKDETAPFLLQYYQLIEYLNFRQDLNNYISGWFKTYKNYNLTIIENKEEKKSLLEQNRYCLIDKDWIKKWRKHTGYEEIKKKFQELQLPIESGEKNYKLVSEIIEKHSQDNLLFPLNNSKIYVNNEVVPDSDFELINKECYRLFTIGSKKTTDISNCRTFPVYFLKEKYLIIFNDNLFWIVFKEKTKQIQFEILIKFEKINQNKKSIIEDLTDKDINEWVNNIGFNLFSDEEKEINIYDCIIIVINKSLKYIKKNGLKNSVNPYSYEKGAELINLKNSISYKGLSIIKNNTLINIKKFCNIFNKNNNDNENNKTKNDIKNEENNNINNYSESMNEKTMIIIKKIKKEENNIRNLNPNQKSDGQNNNNINQNKEQNNGNLNIKDKNNNINNIINNQFNNNNNNIANNSDCNNIGNIIPNNLNFNNNNINNNNVNNNIDNNNISNFNNNIDNNNINNFNNNIDNNNINNINLNNYNNNNNFINNNNFNNNNNNNNFINNNNFNNNNNNNIINNNNFNNNNNNIINNNNFNNNNNNNNIINNNNFNNNNNIINNNNFNNNNNNINFINNNNNNFNNENIINNNFNNNNFNNNFNNNLNNNINNCMINFDNNIINNNFANNNMINMNFVQQLNSFQNNNNNFQQMDYNNMILFFQNMYNKFWISNNMNFQNNFINNNNIDNNLNLIYPHKSGLQNIGQTCYMNATIECLSNIKVITDYFIRNFGTFNVQRQSLTASYSNILFQLFMTKEKYIAPKL